MSKCSKDVIYNRPAAAHRSQLPHITPQLLNLFVFGTQLLLQCVAFKVPSTLLLFQVVQLRTQRCDICIMRLHLMPEPTSEQPDSLQQCIVFLYTPVPTLSAQHCENGERVTPGRQQVQNVQCTSCAI